MALKLYVVPASHPCAAVEVALRRKGLAYERVDLIPVLHILIQRARFGQGTVPGLAADGQRVVGSRQIMRMLDVLAPEPPLYPAEATARARVEAAEAWGDDVLQALTRRLAWAHLRRDPAAMTSYAEGSDLPLPDWMARASAGLVARTEILIHHAGDDAARADLAALPGLLEHADALIADGVIGGPEPNAADLQIASSVALLATFGDLGPLLDERPCAQLARRLFPDTPGHVPAGALPADWVPVPARAGR